LSALNRKRNPFAKQARDEKDSAQAGVPFFWDYRLKDAAGNSSNSFQNKASGAPAITKCAALLTH
jgi:hypothetical protein